MVRSISRRSFALRYSSTAERMKADLPCFFVSGSVSMRFSNALSIETCTGRDGMLAVSNKIAEGSTTHRDASCWATQSTLTLPIASPSSLLEDAPGQLAHALAGGAI